jgi:hypothetical protein
MEYQVEDTTVPMDGATHSASTPSQRNSSSSSSALNNPNPSQLLSSKYPSEHGLTCLGWNDCQFEPPRIVVGGFSRKAIVFRIEGASLSEVSIILE